MSQLKAYCGERDAGKRVHSADSSGLQGDARLCRVDMLRRFPGQQLPPPVIYRDFSSTLIAVFEAEGPHCLITALSQPNL